LSIEQARDQLATRLGLKRTKPRIVWEHNPDGWQEEHYISLTGKQQKAYRKRNGHYTNMIVKPARGKRRCQHDEYIKNRNGKILTDPDTGYLAKIGCKQIARWQENDMTSGLFNVVSRWCDKHAVERGAR